MSEEEIPEMLAFQERDEYANSWDEDTVQLARKLQRIFQEFDV